MSLNNAELKAVSALIARSRNCAEDARRIAEGGDDFATVAKIKELAAQAGDLEADFRKRIEARGAQRP